MHIDHDALLSSLTDQCLTITLFLSGPSSPHTLGSVFSNPASFFLVGFRALTP